MGRALNVNKRVSASREVAKHLKVGVTVVVQIISPLQKVEFRHPARMVGWSRGKYILLELEKVSKSALVRISGSLRERCILRYIEDSQAFALESRMLEVFEMQKMVFISTAWCASVNIYQYRADQRVRAELSCNVRRLEDSEEQLHGQITDVHLKGCCLIIPTASMGTLKIGDMVQIELPVSGEEDFPSICAEIRNMRSHEEMSIFGLSLRDLPAEAETVLRQVMSGSSN